MHLGKFDILEEVGHGGFGTVYRANDTSLDRVVALKVLHEQYKTDLKFIESFKREARLMAKVSHPNVVQLFEVGDLDGQIYIAMQYFDDGNLEQKIQSGGPLPLTEAVRMLNQVARGLEAGHKIGLIHRDVKPSNILYSQNGYIAISDFGVMKSIKQGSTDTTNSFNQFAGSPYYIPPEVWQSKSNLSPAADVYSLACVFYEALTGEILFEGDTYEHVLTRHVLEAPIFSKSLPDNFVNLLTVALAKNPSDRYQTMNDFLMATRAALESKRKKGDTTESSTQTDKFSELPEPLSPGEVSFDQLVKQAERRTAPQSQASKPAQQIASAQPVIEPKSPAPEITQKDIKPVSPAKETAPAVSEVKKPSESPSGPKSQTQKAELKSGKDNSKPLADSHLADTETATIPPALPGTRPKFEDVPPTKIQAEDQTPATTSQFSGGQARKKNKIVLPLLIGLGLVSLLTVFLIFRNEIFPPQTNPGTETRASQSQTPTATTAAASFRKHDGMEMVFVPGGFFDMGSDVGDEDEQPVRRVYLDDYWIDKFEVTNAQYAQCVSEGACTEPSSTSSYTRENYFGNASYTDYPVVHITWYQAQNYCQWTGGNLPTEAQWEKAARGTDKREYPWGNETPDYSRANYDLSIGDTTAVGSYSSGASPYGAMDLAGNVGEWVQDGFAPYSLEKVYNPIGTFNTPYRAIRGGNYFDLPSDIRSAYRFYGEPSLSGYDIGFRCILPPETSELSTTDIDPQSHVLSHEPIQPLEIGSTAFREQDGMEMAYVPEGHFEMGSDAGDYDEKPVRQIYLDAYWIDKYEVTNEQYALCVAVGACSPPSSNSSDSRNYYYGNPVYSKFPVVYMTWSQASDYCQWVGGNLPTEAQWEKAARGMDRREYPWGNDAPDETWANYAYNNANSMEVGSFSKSTSPYGAFDMSGNVWEWVRDWYGPYETNVTINPLGPNSGEFKVMRGGCWYSNADYVRTSYRSADLANNASYSYGFRCALIP